mgnify:CR=1 FL=1
MPHPHAHRVRRDYHVPSPPSQAPQRGNAFVRWLGRSILRLGGWRIVGEFPNVPKLVVIVAPHSSAWDGIWGLPAMLAMGVDLAIMGKRELFFWPLGALLRWLGAFPVNRRNSAGLMEQVTTQCQSSALLAGLGARGHAAPRGALEDRFLAHRPCNRCPGVLCLLSLSRQSHRLGTTIPSQRRP